MKEMISVIVPIYKSEKYLNRCVNSLIAQTYKNIEIILVDDGSSDSSGKICDKYAVLDKRVKVIHQKNGGVCKARNAGMDFASGKYISFLDADDNLYINALEYLYEQIVKYDADISIAQKIVISNLGKKIEFHYPKAKSIWQGNEGLVKSLEDHPATYSVWGKLYKKEFLKDIRFKEGMRIHEDSFFLFICMTKQPKVIVNDEPIIQINQTQGSASRGAFSERMFDIIYLAEEKKAIIEKYYPEYNDKINNLMIKANLALLHSLCKSYGFKYRKYEKKCIEEVISNKKFFQPAIKEDSKWFWIVTHHLYLFYKIFFTIRLNYRNLRNRYL